MASRKTSRPMSKGVYIAMLIVAILFAIALGLPILTIAPVLGVVLLAVAVYFIILSVKGIKLYNTAKETPVQPIEPQLVAEPATVKDADPPSICTDDLVRVYMNGKRISLDALSTEKSAPVAPPAPANQETHKVAGLSFHEAALAALQCENGDFSSSKRELVDMGMIGERIYKYDFYPVKTELIPEPDNEVDPNAIKVVVDGEHIGYIKKGSCAHIRKLLNSGSIEKIDVEIGGGPYKFITAEDWDENGGDVYTIEKGTAPYFAKLTITKT